MNKLFTMLFTAFSAVSFTQITVDAGDFPSGGDTAMVSISDAMDIDFESSGEDYIWDYGSINRTEQRIDTFFDVSTASLTYQFVFNNAWLEPDYESDYYTSLLDFVIPSTDAIGVSFANPVGFTKIETDVVQNVGIGVEISGVQVPVKSEIIDLVYALPLNFSDDWVSNSFLEIDLNPAYDGIFRRYQTRTSLVDGYGEITTPFATFEAIRIKSTLEYTDSVRINIGGMTTWIPLPTPNQTYYTWISKDQKIPVMEVVTQTTAGTETISSIEYKDKFRGYAAVSEEQETQVEIYPNPTRNQLNIVNAQAYNALSIYSLDGKQVLYVDISNNTQKIDVSMLNPGVFVVRLTGADNTPERISQLVIAK